MAKENISQQDTAGNSQEETGKMAKSMGRDNEATKAQEHSGEQFDHQDTEEWNHMKQDPFDMLIKDHRHVQKNFETFEERSWDRASVYEDTVIALTVHTKLEEQLVYPLLAENGQEDKSLEAAEEHRVVDFVITELKELEIDDEKFAAKFKVLKELVNHHIKEEEEEIIPLMRKMDIDLNFLAQELQQLKSELQEEYSDLESVEPLQSTVTSGHRQSQDRKRASRKSASSSRSGATRKSSSAKKGGSKSAAKKSAASSGAKSRQSGTSKSSRSSTTGRSSKTAKSKSSAGKPTGSSSKSSGRSSAKRSAAASKAGKASGKARRTSSSRKGRSS